MSGEKDTSALPVTLFPHSYAIPETFRCLRDMFGRVRLCLPWYMEPPPGAHEEGVEILRPPEILRPEKDFNALLKEYLGWMEEHAARGDNSFVHAARELLEAEETTWGIGRTLRRMGGGRDNESESDQAFRWHMILHLSAEVEKSRAEAEQILRKLKQESSPLKEALDEIEEPVGVLDDLPPGEGSGDERRVSRTLKAWTGLFGRELDRETILVTFDREVMDHVAGLLEEHGPAGSHEIFEVGVPSFAGDDARKKALEPLRTILRPAGPKGEHASSASERSTEGNRPVPEGSPDEGARLRVLPLPQDPASLPRPLQEEIPPAGALLYFSCTS